MKCNSGTAVSWFADKSRSSKDCVVECIETDHTYQITTQGGVPGAECTDKIRSPVLLWYDWMLDEAR